MSLFREKDNINEKEYISIEIIDIADANNNHAGVTTESFIEMAGGFARDADTNGVYLLKANGLAYRGKNADRIENGDVIVVPTRVMVERVNERWDQIFSVVRLTLVTVTTAYLVGQFTK